MSESIEYKDLHSVAKALISRVPPDDLLKKDLALEVLMKVEIIRDAAKELMGFNESEFAADILLCIAAEARQVKLQREPDWDGDYLLFDDCADDEFLHTFIHARLTRPRGS